MAGEMAQWVKDDLGSITRTQVATRVCGMASSPPLRWEVDTAVCNLS